MKRLAMPMAALVLAASPALAGSGGFDGFYTGSGIGGGVGHAHTTSYGVNGSADNGLSGVSGNFFGGYGASFLGNIYTGVEANFDLSSFTIHDHNKFGTLDKITRPYGFGAVGRLGFEVTPQFMFYGDAGLAYNHFDAYRFGAKQGKWDPGLQAGGGGEYNFGQGVFGRLSYEADYNRVYFDAFATSSRTLTHTGKLGVGYRF